MKEEKRDPIRDNLIKIPEGLSRKVAKAKEVYYKETGRRLSNQDLAEILNIPVVKLDDLERASYSNYYPRMHERIKIDNEETVRLSDTISDETFMNPLERIEYIEELENKLRKTKDVRKIAVLKEELARIKLEFDSD